MRISDVERALRQQQAQNKMIKNHYEKILAQLEVLTKNTIQVSLFERWFRDDINFIKKRSFVGFWTHLVLLAHLAHFPRKHLVLLLKITNSTCLHSIVQLSRKGSRGNHLVLPLVVASFPQRGIPTYVALRSIRRVTCHRKPILWLIWTQFSVDWTLRGVAPFYFLGLFLIVFLWLFDN